MSDPQNSPPRWSQGPIPPPPPRPERPRGGCLRVGLIGCGALLLLGIAAAVAGGIWWKRNAGSIGAEAVVAGREGARYGVSHDEAACFEQAKQRITGSASIAGSVAVTTYMQRCLEFSRQTPAFCDDVPPQTALRRTLEWQSARCGDDSACRGVTQGVQAYCTAGRLKRPAADTVQVMTDTTLFDMPPPAGAPPAPDSGSF